ncbi:hypothetical protein Glove_396g60 [Diversispora epigaea]|uniref:Amino acid transporter transmembrane domain-containing protein n=1 Tax=Diversispora epigaea TaxID=1348612 RepID=A0A397H8U5_9GLOM|nr:hypothetical protein Glove_396g60 [Diversispora epigaea]
MPFFGSTNKITFVGGMAVLISAMMGPGIVTIPLLFQTAGWLTSILMFVIAIMLSVSSALLLCEAISSIPGNKRFSKKIEYIKLSQTLISNLFFQRLVEFFHYASLESLTIASIILSSQSVDNLFVDLVNITCGFGLYPDFGFVCVHKIGSENSPFGNSWMLLTIGLIITLIIVIPMALMELSNNAKIQIVSFITMSLIMIIWVVTAILHGLNFNYVPIIGDEQSQVVGTVLFNYVLALTISSVVSGLEKDVPIRKLVLSSTLIVTIFYLSLGIFGALAYKFETSANIISTIHRIETDNEFVQIATYLFPFILIFSMSINAIVIRYNLIRSGICKSEKMAIFLTLLPWILVIPFQTGYWLAIFTNWTSIIFISSSNFIIPFWLYILSQKRKLKITDVKLEKELTEKKKVTADIVPLKDVIVTTSSSHLSSPQSSLTPTKNIIISAKVEGEQDEEEEYDEFTKLFPFKAFGCFEERDENKIDNDNLRTLSIRIAWIASILSLLMIFWILIYNFIEFV